MILLALLMGALGVTGALPAAAGTTVGYRIIDLGMGDDSSANAINDLGHVVGERGLKPFLWRDGQVVDLLPPGELGRTTDINNRDEVVGYRFVNDTARAFLWRKGAVTDLGVLPGGTNSYAMAVNDRGEIAGWSATGPFDAGPRAVRWRDGVVTDLGAPAGADGTFGRDINNAGVIVGEIVTGADSVAVTWDSAGTVRTLTGPPTVGVSINNRGDVAGLQDDDDRRGFLWRRGQVTEILAPPGAAFLQPYQINDRRQIVGNAGGKAFLWQRGRLTRLPSPAGTSVAIHLNNRGQIVGTSASANPGLYRAVLWTR